MPFTETGGLLTSQNSGAFEVAGTGTAEKVLVDYKDALIQYKATELPVIAMFAETMQTDTGGDIDISFALPSMKMESIDEGSTPKYQHTKMRSERVGVREWGIAVGVTGTAHDTGARIINHQEGFLGLVPFFFRRGFFGL